MGSVRYRILGTTQAVRPDGSVLSIGGARLRALLTVLALRAGRAVPAGLLVDEVWDGDPPADAAGALQALVGRLRRALGAQAVASADGGYRLAAAPDDVDLHRFERLADEGARALADGDPAKAAVLLDDALALWHGPALADLPDRTVEAARWSARRLDARRARLAAALALGHAEQVLPELTALCGNHPLDEPLQALRLRALRDAGRTAEALAAYEDVRRVLADRLGADPGPELRALHADLLNPAPPRAAAFPTPPTPAAARTHATTPTRGTGADDRARTSGGDGWAGGGDWAGVSGGDHAAPVSDGGRPARVSGGDHAARVSGGDHSAGVSGGDDSAGVSGGNYSAPVSGGDHAAPVSGGGRPAPVSGGDDSAGVSGGNYSAPVSGGDHAAPVSGGGRPAPVSGGDDWTGVSGGSHSAPVSGSDHPARVSGGDHSASVPGSDHPAPVPGSDHPARVSGGDRPASVPEAGREVPASGTAWPGAVPSDAGRPAAVPGAAPSDRVPADGSHDPAPGHARSASAAAPATGAAPSPHRPAPTPGGTLPRPATGASAATAVPGPDPSAPWAPVSGAVPSAPASATPTAPVSDAAQPAPAPGAVAPGHRRAAGDVAGVAVGDGRTPPPGNLRARLTSFVGRGDDIDLIRGDLASARLVTLLGPGGAGKTRLSQEAAENVRETAPDGVWLAELAPVDDPAAVPEAVLTAIGARETVLHGAGAEEFRVAVADRHDDPVARLVEHCARRRMLLVLDNCEHVVDAAARLAEELLARCPHLTVLATSREPLGVPGEVLRPVEPLPEPYALRLLADRGAAARPGFRVDDDPEACAEICRRLDGLPLGIELAAARLRMLTPRQIADRLDDRFRLLTSGSRTVLPRQQTLRAVVDWSWDLLDEDEREVLRRLSVFAGGCDLDAAEAVCGPAALDALGSLVDKSLVVATPSADGEMRYRLLETVAEYAGERLDEAGRRRATERAHLTHYRELARTTDPLLRRSGQLAAVERLEREYENLRTALRHAVAERDEQEALCLVLSLVWYWQMRDLRIEARTWCRAVMDLGPDPFAEPAAVAAPVTEPCTAAPPPMTGEVLAEARRGVHLGHLACMDTELDAWQTPEAQRKLRTIAEVYAPGLPQTCRSPGMLSFYAVMLTGDMARLSALIDAAVDTCRATPGFDWELAASLQLRANVLANRPDRATEAGRDADESLAIYERLGDSWGSAEALSARAESLERKGRHLEAAADYEAAREHAQRLGARAQHAILSARLGSALLEAGETERGERLVREVLAAGEGAHSEAMPFGRLILSGWLSITGRTAEAREHLRMLREEFVIAHFVVFDAFILGQEAWVEAADGHYEAAREKIRRALAQADDPLSKAMAPQLVSSYLFVAALALVGCDGGRHAEDAARCLGAADALLPPGYLCSSLERGSRERATEAVRSALSAARFTAAYAEGGGLSPQEAAALV
ncbi:BTAD domain-containing putative transcriptional regulator [Streptomyces sp. NPDC089424]|uniref:BTAD domain-containing putative transcriptional regulator n=1 Tax=Streptomyces sp. NPDC089424 TaxID=3365917 RepID=UPI0038167BCA